MKYAILCSIGSVGSAVALFFGGWDASIVTLIIFMAIDYFTGLILAGVFRKSKKSQNGKLESKAGWKGLCRKGVTLLIVLISCRLDIMLGSSYIRDAVCIAFIVNELISIIENAGLMGVPIPSVITKAIELLHQNETDALSCEALN